MALSESQSSATLHTLYTHLYDFSKKLAIDSKEILETISDMNNGNSYVNINNSLFSFVLLANQTTLYPVILIFIIDNY